VGDDVQISSVHLAVTAKGTFLQPTSHVPIQLLRVEGTGEMERGLRAAATVPPER
jgi:hypothetical protein